MAVLKSADELRRLGVGLFEAVGTPHDIAELVVGSLVRANLAGHDSHGVLRIPPYVRAVQRGRIVADARPETLRETPTSALIDGKCGFGQVAAGFGTDLAVGKAKQNGVAVVGVLRCNHLGRLGEYSSRAARQGAVLLITSGGRSDGVAPYGGRSGALGTNPLSLCMPAGERPPVLVDFATAAVAGGKVVVARNTKQPLPPGCIVDKLGNPSTNPEDYFDGGMLLPFGGHKGYGLSIMSALLSGPLIGAEDLGLDDGGGSSGPQRGCFILAIDASLFRPLDELGRDVDQLLQLIKETPPAPGFEAVLAPGEPEVHSEERRLREGIPVADSTWSALEQTAQGLGVLV